MFVVVINAGVASGGRVVGPFAETLHAAAWLIENDWEEALASSSFSGAMHSLWTKPQQPTPPSPKDVAHIRALTSP